MITTSDLYRITYFTIEGLQILDTRTSINGRNERIVEFILAGGNETIEKEIERKFETGRAVINLREYLDKLFNLRSVMYELKKNDEDTRKTTGKIVVKQEAKYGKNRNRDV